MEELRLCRLVLFTRFPTELGDFFADLLGAEVCFTGAGHFTAELDGLYFEVRPGSPAAGEEWDFKVGPEAWADLQARWDFFRFRRGEQAQLRSAQEILCQDADGRLWRLQSSSDRLPISKPPDSVRNY